MKKDETFIDGHQENIMIMPGNTGGVMAKACSDRGENEGRWRYLGKDSTEQIYNFLPLLFACCSLDYRSNF